MRKVRLIRAARRPGVAGLVLGLAAILLVGACGQGGGNGGQGSDLKIAVAGPMSGSDAQYGSDFWRGATLAAADINARGGVKGGKITFEKFDDVDDTTQAANVAQKIGSDSSLAAVLGHFTTPTVLATMPIYKQNQIPQVVVSASNPKITELGDRWLFRVNAPITFEADQVAKGLAGQAKPHRVAAVYLNTDYGTADHAAFTAAAKRYGLDIVASEPYQPNTTDFTNLILKLKDSHADAVYMSSYYNDAALIIKQAVAAGFASRYYSPGSLYSPAFIQVGGNAVEGNTWANTLPDSSTLRTVTREYQAKYGADPDSFVLNAYAGVQAIAEAAREKGTSRSQIRDGLAQEKNVATPLGSLTFNAQGQYLPQRAGWVTVRGGRWQRVDSLAAA
jgi:branched-chain amino acid transport system substrate-binding protein